MKNNLWKKIWSYIYEIPLEKIATAYNPDLNVSLTRGRYQLATKNAIYSFDDLYSNFADAFQELPLEKYNIQKVLLLGLGLGSIPHILEKKLGKCYEYTAVEIDEAIIELAQKYTLNDLQSDITYVCSDGISFVQSTAEQFDLIAMDIFQDDQIPPEFETAEFLHALKDLLSENGILLYNRLAQLPKDRTASQAFFKGVFSKVFPQATYIDVKSNWILVNKKV